MTAMTVARICWYLCGLFAVALVAASAITFHPEAQAARWLLTSGTAALSAVFGVLAVVSRQAAFAQRRWLVRVFQCLAVLATITVILMLGG
jgi:hypothetical protein